MILAAISLFICTLFVFYNKKIAKFLNIYDNPDNSRKIHSKKVALTGGLILLLNVLIVECFLFLNFDLLENLNPFKSKKDLLIFSCSSFLIFLIGFIDDKTGLSANLKFLIMVIITIPVITISDDLLIQYIRLSFLEETYKLPFVVSIFWTLLCFLLFLNALNMFDGINYQVGFYSIFICIFFILNNYFYELFFTISIGLIFFLFLNHRNKSFLGDSGSYLLAFIFSYFFIKFYNQPKIIGADHVVLFMLIPGLDLMRLFITRIYNGRLPFSPDKNHIHHILLAKNNLIVTNIKTQSLIFIPAILGFLFGYVYIFLFIQLLLYFLIVFQKIN